jgi:tetratricopeptide (TPR) repeat protein
VVAYTRWRESHARRDLVVSVAAYALALCSKEVAAIVPILLVLYDVVVLRNALPGHAPRGWRRALVRMAPYVAVLAAYAGVRRLALATFVMAPATPWADGVTRALTTVKMAAWYVRLAILPYPTTLSYEVIPERFPPGVVWCAAAVMLALTLGATLVAMRRWPVVGFGARWFWIALVPMLGASILPTRKPLMADNFLYLSMAGFAVIVGAVAPRLLGAGEIARGTRVRPRAAIALGIVLVGYGAFTLWRSADWRDEYRLTLRSVEGSPTAAHPRVNLALNQLQQGDVAGARANLAFAATRAPDDAVIAAALGFAESYLGDREGGLRHTLRAQELAPDNTVALSYVAESYVRLGDLPRAEEALQRSLRLKPDQVPATMTLATVQHLLGRDDDALVTLERGIALNGRTHQHDLLIHKVTAQLTAKRDPARARISWERYMASLRALAPTPQVAAEIAVAQRQLQLLGGK